MSSDRPTRLHMPKPTIEEQIKAVAVLRAFAKIVPAVANPTDAEREVADAINTLNDADLFADLDEEEFDLYRCGDTSAGLPEPPCDLEKPCPVHGEEIGLPTLKPGQEVRPDFSDTHPRAARELGEVIGGDGE